MTAKRIILGVVVLVVLAVAYYGISPIFRHVRANEAIPTTNQTVNPPSSAAALPATQGAPLVGTTGHPASGTARIVRADGRTYLRYEDFKTLNGPDLYIYLSKDLNAKEYVSLGKIRATEGNVNYEIPANVNVDEYPYALTWCKQFGVLFNSVTLN